MYITLLHSQVQLRRIIFIGYWIYIVKYSAQVHMVKDARASEWVSAYDWIFHNRDSVTFLLYTLKIFILWLIMLLTNASDLDWLAHLSMLNVSNDRSLHQIQHFQQQNNVFIHTWSHILWPKMENNDNVTSMTLLTKQWHQRESDANCTLLTAWNFLNILRIWNGNILYFIPNER